MYELRLNKYKMLDDVSNWSVFIEAETFDDSKKLLHLTRK